MTFFPFQTMRKREIQSFSLKLIDLKEYEMVRQDRNDANNQVKELETPTTTAPPPIIKIGPKTKQEIRERLGLNN